MCTRLLKDVLLTYFADPASTVDRTAITENCDVSCSVHQRQHPVYTAGYHGCADEIKRYLDENQRRRQRSVSVTCAAPSCADDIFRQRLERHLGDCVSRVNIGEHSSTSYGYRIPSPLRADFSGLLSQYCSGTDTTVLLRQRQSDSARQFLMPGDDDLADAERSFSPSYASYLLGESTTSGPIDVKRVEYKYKLPVRQDADVENFGMGDGSSSSDYQSTKRAQSTSQLPDVSGNSDIGLVCNVEELPRGVDTVVLHEQHVDPRRCPSTSSHLSALRRTAFAIVDEELDSSSVLESADVWRPW